jgi:hypothetical protein
MAKFDGIFSYLLQPLVHNSPCLSGAFYFEPPFLFSKQRRKTMSEMQYSTGLVTSGDMSPRPFSEIPSLWLKVTQMTEAFFAEEAPRASQGGTLVSILVYAIVDAILTALSALIGGGLQALSQLPEFGRQPELGATYGAGVGSVVLCSACVGLIAVPISFYLNNALNYLGARVLGGTGNFSTQAYLMSLFAVPLGMVGGLASLVPYAGACVASLIGIYVIFLTVRLNKTVHQLTTGRAIVAALWPLLLIPLVACAVIGVLLVLGPVVGNVFSNIVQNLETPMP